MEDSKSSKVRSLETTFAIIETIEERNGGGVTEIANEIGVAKSTVHKHLKTLELHEFVVHEGDEYHIGLRFLDHGSIARRRKKLYQVGQSEVRELANRTGEIANLVVPEHGRSIYLYVKYGPDAVSLDTYIGQREYMHTTGVGKAMLAFMDEMEVDRVVDLHGLPAETNRTITDREELAQALSRIKERGYAIDDQECLDGLRCVGVPVLSSADEVVGGISLSGPTRRVTKDDIQEELADAVLRAANIVEINMRYD